MTNEVIDAALRQIRAAVDALAPLLGDGAGGSGSGMARQPLQDEAASARVAELEHLLAGRDEFIATIAHELRNALTPILVQTHVVNARLSATAQLATTEWTLTQVRRLEAQLGRVTEILDQLLDLSRLSSGRIDVRVAEADLGELVRDVISGFEAEIAASRSDVRFEQSGPLVGLWDRMRIEQVCRNLLSNALKYGGGQPIEVRIEGHELFAVLEVRDHGVGIDSQHQNRIFDRFDRGRIERRGGGFGVGLWVVKNICLALGGTVNVESEPGQGAKFTVVLPRKRPAPTDVSDA